KNINVQAGFNGSLNETHTKKSGWFSGGHLYSRSEDLEGKLNKTAVKSRLSGKHVSLNAGNNIAIKGADVAAGRSLAGKARNITVENTNNEVKTWSRHEKLTIGFGDAMKRIAQPYKAVKYDHGKASITLARADFSKAEKVTTKTTVVGSNLKADNIDLVAGASAKQQGDLTIKGSDLTARNDAHLTAGHNVTIKEAKRTEKTASKDMRGTAELKVTAQNEYVQVGYAVNEARKAEKRLKNAKQAYTRYRRELGKQRSRLLRLKADLANGKPGIEQADVDEMASLIDDLKADDAYYKANIALAASDLASKTTAVASQMAAAAASSGTYGFSASLELDLDALAKKFDAYKEQSVGSNIHARNINIAAGSTATVRGSNLNAANTIDIAARDTNILASQDVNTSSNSSD
ncbi:MAG: hemagglutinin repeat-containing protein, partial [Mariprofundaceae bacterium]|nr:hemagglutinin repeat-containing protein [Mariprofundaceae bacterium]